MDAIYLIKLVLYAACAGIMLSIMVLIIQGVLIARSVRHMIERVEWLTDVKGWWSLLRKVPDFVSKKKDKT